MRKTLTILTLAVIALLLAAGPALAAGSARDIHVANKATPPQKAYVLSSTAKILAAGAARDFRVAKKTTPPKEAHIISLTGTVLTVDNGQITVAVQMTNIAFRSFRGTTATVYTADSKILEWTSATKPRQRIPCDALAMGDKVSINGWVLSSDTISARRIEVNKPRYSEYR